MLCLVALVGFLTMIFLPATSLLLWPCNCLNFAFWKLQVLGFAANQQFGRLTRQKLKIPPRLHNLWEHEQQLQWGEIKKGITPVSYTSWSTKLFQDRISDSPFVESIVSNSRMDQQRQILYPSPFALSLESASLEATLAEQFEKWKPLEFLDFFCQNLIIQQNCSYRKKDLRFAFWSGFNNWPAAAKMKCLILYPNKFAS